jgi:hypothetical protein
LEDFSEWMEFVFHEQNLFSFSKARVAWIAVPLLPRKESALLSFRFSCPLVARGQAMGNVGSDPFKDA